LFEQRHQWILRVLWDRARLDAATPDQIYFETVPLAEAV
jgi:hypothetical protein